MNESNDPVLAVTERRLILHTFDRRHTKTQHRIFFPRIRCFSLDNTLGGYGKKENGAGFIPRRSCIPVYEQ
jgi:hypothetical protein